jgi:hypothetical protein
MNWAAIGPTALRARTRNGPLDPSLALRSQRPDVSSLDGGALLKRRSFFGLVAFGMLAIVTAACGAAIDRVGAGATQGASPSANPSPSGSTSPFSPQSHYGPRVITFVVRAGADPAIVGRRIAGPNAVARPAYPPGYQEENLPRTIIARTFIVPVAPEDLQPALKRARADPDVQLAYIGTHLGA